MLFLKLLCIILFIIDYRLFLFLAKAKFLLFSIDLRNGLINFRLFLFFLNGLNCILNSPWSFFFESFVPILRLLLGYVFTFIFLLLLFLVINEVGGAILSENEFWEDWHLTFQRSLRRTFLFFIFWLVRDLIKGSLFVCTWLLRLLCESEGKNWLSDPLFVKLNLYFFAVHYYLF